MPRTIDIGQDDEFSVSEKLDYILERLDELEEKIDNLNLTSNTGFEGVDEL